MDGQGGGADAWRETVAVLAACRLCAARFAATPTGHAPRPVFQIAPGARLLIASQAPGLRAHRAGRTFDDPSGDRLRAWMGIGRETFYDDSRIAIVPMGFCFPGHDSKGGDLPPPSLCAETWRARMLALLPGLRLTLLVGQYAQAWHLGRGRSLTERVRDRAALPSGVMALPHPSWRNTGWLKRNPWFEAEVLPRLRAEVARVLT